MGYTGGALPSPTYRSMGDHTESFQVDYDPSVISYDDLLETFWTSHDPTYRAWKVQYASRVLAGDDAQLEAARSSAERMGRLLGRPVETLIEPLERFWIAEDYHQKYYLRQEPVLAAEFEAMFEGDEAAFRESTATARANGYVYGAAGCTRLDAEIPLLGLSADGSERLRERCLGGAVR